MNQICRWLSKHKDAISSGTSILTLLVAALGFWATWDQLSKAKIALQSGNTYQIQKDGRDLINAINSTGHLFKYIEGDRSSEAVQGAKVDLWNVINFYISVHRQARARGIGDDFIERYKRDFCAFVMNDDLSALLKQLKARKTLGEGLNEMERDWC